MHISLEKKSIVDVYDTPIIQQTSFWSQVKKKQGLKSLAFDYKVRNRDLYLNGDSYSCTQADFLMFVQQLNANDCVVYVPYGPENRTLRRKSGVF